MGTRVVARAAPGEEGVAGPHLPVVGAQRAAQPRREPGGGGRGGVELLQHQKLSSSAGPGCTTICGRISMSVGTFIMRSVCCTTWLNTGAAISPP